jgi:transcriptional regulator with XRE-family HTH domain
MDDTKVGEPRVNPACGSEHAYLGAVLVRAREAARLSQAEVGIRVGRSTAHIDLVETGQHHIGVLELFNWLRVLGVEPSVVVAEVFRQFARLRRGSNNGATSQGMGVLCSGDPGPERLAPNAVKPASAPSVAQACGEGSGEASHAQCGFGWTPEPMAIEEADQPSAAARRGAGKWT